MATLLIELQAPLQSWGYRSRFTERDTGQEPSKSGIVGIVAAAFGRKRNEPVDDLADLLFGVRVDREGIVKKDFQTAQNIIKADNKGFKDTELTNKYYLCDAAFVAGFEGEKEKLLQIRDALLNPVFPPFLGRKACIPCKPLINTSVPHLIDVSLLEAFKVYPLIATASAKMDRVRIVYDAPWDSDSVSQDIRTDVPVSFDRKEYLKRKVISDWIPKPVGKEQQ